MQNTLNTLTTSNGHIAYEQQGRGAPLVLAHAGFVNRQMWNAQWDALSADHTLVRYDLQGYGASPLPDAPLSRRAELLHLLDSLDIERAVLIGCSLSGATVLDFALEHPERVAALVLVATVPGGFAYAGPPPTELMSLFGAIQTGAIDQAIALQEQLWVDGPYRQPGTVSADVRSQVASMTRPVLEQQTLLRIESAPLAPLDPPAIQRLSACQAPTLLVVGALDNPEVLRANFIMQHELPNAQLVALPDAAHLPNMEQPDMFNQAVRAFLQRIEA